MLTTVVVVGGGRGVLGERVAGGEGEEGKGGEGRGNCVSFC